MSYRASPGIFATLLLFASPSPAPAAAEPDMSAAAATRQLAAVAVAALGRRQVPIVLAYSDLLAAQCPGTGVGRAPVITSFSVSGLNQYARVDVPAGAAPAAGFPVVVFLHGWVGAANAPDWRFGCNPAYVYEAAIDAFVRAGFLVITPGYRGHGSARGKPADGLDYLQRWDYGAYAMPNFYAQDVLGLLAGLSAAGSVPASVDQSVKIDPKQIFLKAHSQGGDVALTVLSALNARPGSLRIAGASIWAGTIADRLTQATFHAAMQSSPQAFLAGDGSWTGSGRGRNGKLNRDFVFGYPGPAIGTPDPARWTGQRQIWNVPKVAAAYAAGLRKLYAAYAIAGDASAAPPFTIRRAPSGRLFVRHDPRLLALINTLAPSWRAAAKTPTALHFSDHDFHSPPAWNRAFCAQARRAGRTCVAYRYPGNTHELGVSGLTWFSPPGTEAGLDRMLQRDIAFFGRQPAARRASSRNRPEPE
jgi:alpha-beta hydrolase superfamily lysophospholipase